MNMRLAGTLCVTAALVLLLAAGQAAQASAKQSPTGLTLSVIAPDPASIGERLSLDVSYRGGSVEAVEVYLDGNLVAKRQLAGAPTHGVLTFVIETMMLTEGDHDVLIRAYGADGRSASVPARIRIPGPDLSAPVRIAYPLNGIQVSGIVPIRVKLDDQLQRQRPYVTFFINKELKALRNYPPYEYNWDTTTYPNGWYSLEAWTQSPEMTAPIRSRPVNVNVNNSGGFTQRQTTVEDLRAPAQQPATQGPAKPADPQRSVVLSPEPSVPSGGAPGPVASGARTAPVTGARMAEPGTRSGALRSLPAATPPSVGSSVAKLPRVPSAMVGPSPMEPTTKPRAEAKPAVPATVTVREGDTLGDVSRRTGVSPQEIARMNNIRPNQSAALPTGQKLVVPTTGPFDVAFDGVVLAFDVVPRVEAGIGLAPIRQIFEHTGGRLYWYGQSKAVRAVNDTREIELRIGRPTAMVNNRTISLERAPFLESGRTLVPLSFVRDALSVDVSFDQASGRVLLRSK